MGHSDGPLRRATPTGHSDGPLRRAGVRLDRLADQATAEEGLYPVTSPRTSSRRARRATFSAIPVSQCAECAWVAQRVQTEQCLTHGFLQGVLLQAVSRAESSLADPSRERLVPLEQCAQGRSVAAVAQVGRAVVGPLRFDHQLESDAGRTRAFLPLTDARASATRSASARSTVEQCVARVRQVLRGCKSDSV
jgi:hypothetical protein